MTATKIWDGTQWVIIQGAKGDPGPQGPRGVEGQAGASGFRLNDDVALAGGELVQGSVGAPVAIPRPSYGTELRRKGLQLGWGMARAAHIADRDNIDLTGENDVGAIISTYLAEYYNAGIMHIYFDPGIYQIEAPSTIIVDQGMRLEGPSHLGGYRFPQYDNIARLRASGINPIILTIPNSKKSVNIRGLTFDLGRSTEDNNAIGIWNGATALTTIEENWFTHGDPSSTAVKGGGILYYTFRRNVMNDLEGRGLDLLQEHVGVDYYGVNVGVIEENLFSGRMGALRWNGDVDILHNDFESGSGKIGPAIHAYSANYTAQGTISDNYVEGALYAIKVDSGSSPDIEGNTLFASPFNQPGSYGIWWDGSATRGVITDNSVLNFETGIRLPYPNSFTFAMHVEVSNNRVQGGTTPYLGTEGYTDSISKSSLGTVPGKTVIYRPQDGRNWVHGATIPRPVTYSADSMGTTIIASQADHFIIHPETAGAVFTCTGAKPGQRITIINSDNAKTYYLDAATFGSVGGGNIPIGPGEVRQFIGVYTGGAKEVSVRLPQQAANPDTSGATLAALETEVNELKAALRAAGVIGT